MSLVNGGGIEVLSTGREVSVSSILAGVRVAVALSVELERDESLSTELERDELHNVWSFNAVAVCVAS